MMRSALASFLVVFSILPAPVGAEESDPYLPLQWGLRAIEADAARAVSSGEGIVVAVIDTGVDAAHPDLRGRILNGKDFVDDDDDARDRNGHGTLVAGIVAAATGNGVGVASVAPGVDVLPVRVLDEDGTGSSDDVADGIRWAADRGADIINLSLAQEADSVLRNLLSDPAVDEAIVDAAARGLLVVVAAGNDPDGGHDRTAYDATQPGVLVVGATIEGDRPAAYSNFGEGLDLVAPGGGSATDPTDGACSRSNGVVSTWWNPETGRSAYGAGCGTSMSVGFVSGVGAMLMSSGMDNLEAAKRILATAADLGPAGPDDRTGVGRLDARRALDAPRLGASGTATTRVRGARTSRPAVRAQASTRGGIVHPGEAREPWAPRDGEPPSSTFALRSDLDPERGHARYVAIAAALLAALVVAHARRLARRTRALS
jgi:subtilisin family serine protease